MPLEIETRRTGQVAILTCRGRIVYGEETTALREQVKAALAETASIVLDLSGVRDIDSGGVGALVGLYTSVHSRGGDLKLLAPSPKVAEVLHITRLETVFDIHAREDQAVAAFTAPPRRAAG